MDAKNIILFMLFFLIQQFIDMNVTEIKVIILDTVQSAAHWNVNVVWGNKDKKLN